MNPLVTLAHPEELLALVKYKICGISPVSSQCYEENISANMRTCYEFLRRTSRSFYAVIMALDGELRAAVCIYYLVLRALDTVEDDMTIPVDTKSSLLTTFYQKLEIPDWTYNESREKDKIVLENFNVISAEFRNLAPIYQNVISKSCADMGRGMSLFLKNDIDTFADWNEYCHYVAGLVGIGLSRLFSASELEDKIVGEDEKLSNSMGLFLQKTNIVRDFLEDIQESRHFWPRECWSKYASSLPEFAEKGRESAALLCLNELITNALHHLPDVLCYLGRLHNQSIFNFCAIPQVMAIATLERCYNNPEVFRRNVKIRKSEALLLMYESTNINAVKNIFNHYALKINSRMCKTDPSAEEIRRILSQFGMESLPASHLTLIASHMVFATVYAASIWKYYKLTESLFHSLLNR